MTILLVRCSRVSTSFCQNLRFPPAELLSGLCMAQRSQPTRSLSEKAPAPASSLRLKASRTFWRLDVRYAPRYTNCNCSRRHRYFSRPGSRRVEVSERISARRRGFGQRSLQDDDISKALDTLVDRGVEAVAVSLLFSFLYPQHEQRIRDIAKRDHPGLFVSLSSEVDPAFREYERVVATAFDAYTKPVLTSYLNRIEEKLASVGITAPLQVMQSRAVLRHRELRLNVQCACFCQARSRRHRRRRCRQRGGHQRGNRS